LKPKIWFNLSDQSELLQQYRFSPVSRRCQYRAVWFYWYYWIPIQSVSKVQLLELLVTAISIISIIYIISVRQQILQMWNLLLLEEESTGG